MHDTVTMNIIITGASRGIGYELVKALSKHRLNKIVALSRNAKGLKELMAECKQMQTDARVTTYEFDLNQFDFYPFLLQRLETFIHKCDILINNAGKLISKPFQKIETADFDEMYNVNVKAAFFLTQTLLPIMNKGAHIVNIGSMGGITGSQKYPGLTAYSSSKGALSVLTEILAEELKEADIKVNCLALGSVQTEMFGKAFPGIKAALTPQQMATFIADFAISGHKYMNGKVIPVALSVP